MKPLEKHQKIEDFVYAFKVWGIDSMDQQNVNNKKESNAPWGNLMTVIQDDVNKTALGDPFNLLHAKAWFQQYVFLMWKKEHVEMCICVFVFQRYGKSIYGFGIFRHLSCSDCIILTYSLENGERGHVDGSNLLFVYCTCI